MATLELYHSLLILVENNMRVIHWKLNGSDFHEAHARYGEYYEKLGDMIDETAEQMISLGHIPMNMSNALALLSKDTGVHAVVMNPGMDYTSKIADDVTKKMFDELYDFAAHLAVDAAIPVDVQDVFTEHARWFRLTSIYKLGRTVNISVSTEPQTSTTEDVEAIPAQMISSGYVSNHNVLNEEPDDDIPLDDDGSSNVPVDHEHESSMIEPIDDDE